MPPIGKISETFSHGLRGPSSPAPVLSVGAVATPAVGVTSSTDCGLFISAPIFVDTWIARPVRQPVTRDFSFKAVVGEPEW